MEQESRLEPAAELAVNAHVAKLIGRWATALGIANGLFIITSFAYIVFELPRKAEAEAKTIAHAEIDGVTAEWRKHLDELNQSFGAARADLLQVETSLTELKGRASALRDTPIESLIKILADVAKDKSANHTLQTIAEAEPKVERLDQSINELSATISNLNDDVQKLRGQFPQPIDASKVQAILAEISASKGSEAILQRLSNVEPQLRKLDDVSNSVTRFSDDVAKLRQMIRAVADKSTWTIVNRASGKALEIRDGGPYVTAVQQMAPNGSQAQRWQLVREAPSLP